MHIRAGYGGREKEHDVKPIEAGLAGPPARGDGHRGRRRFVATTRRKAHDVRRGAGGDDRRRAGDHRGRETTAETAAPEPTAEETSAAETTAEETTGRRRPPRRRGRGDTAAEEHHRPKLPSHADCMKGTVETEGRRPHRGHRQARVPALHHRRRPDQRAGLRERRGLRRGASPGFEKADVKWTGCPFNSSYAPGDKEVRLRHQPDLDLRGARAARSTSPSRTTRRRRP